MAFGRTNSQWSGKCPYLTFYSNEQFMLASYNSSTGGFIKGWDGILEYSTNRVNWTVWTGVSGPITSSLGSDNNYYIYLRGTNNTYLNTPSWGTSTLCMFVFYKPDFSGQANNIHIKGNIEVLFGYNAVMMGNHPTMANYSCACLFQYQCIVEAPQLLATSLSEYCYASLFYRCEALKVPPKLPATSLATACYSGMFEYCTSLTTVPKLISNYLPQDCYSRMFYGCSSLKVYNSYGSDHQFSWRIPTSGTISGYSTQTDTFRGTIGNYSSSSSVSFNTTFYTQNNPI